MTDIEYLSRVARDSGLREWLQKERDTALKYLVQATDPVSIHRAQGQMLLIDRMLSVLEKARG